jgi:hypothetical protein
MIDWITEAAEEIFRKHELRALYTLPAKSYAAIIAKHAEPLIALLKESKREYHGYDDDGDHCEKTNYLDGTHSCTCGTDEWNAKVDAALKGS